jgi:hypothetical protein
MGGMQNQNTNGVCTDAVNSRNGCEDQNIIMVNGPDAVPVDEKDGPVPESAGSNAIPGEDVLSPPLFAASRARALPRNEKARVVVGNGTGGSGLEFEHVEPWPEPVDGGFLLDELAQVMKRFVVLPKHAAEALALWTLHTYAFHLRDVSAYLGIESPEKRCGKTTLLSVLSEVAHRAVAAANISSSAVFRVIEEIQPTLLIDEADTFLQGNDELRGILNSGYTRKTAYVLRVAAQKPESNYEKLERPETKNSEEENLLSPALSSHANAEAVIPPSPFALSPGRGKGGERGKGGGSRLVRFSCWCPKVMAAIGRLPETLADRCIVIRMQRKTEGEDCERLRLLDALPLRRKCARFVLDHAASIASGRPELPATLNDRAGDIWEPLLALADLAGGNWPEQARQSAAALAANAQESSPIGALLLDILVCFVMAKSDRIFSRVMLGTLNKFQNRPWAEIRNGKPITDLWLSQQLRPYGIRPRTIWIGENQGKGYKRSDFEEVFRRYIPLSEVEALKASSGFTAE